jgi:hypothetical protein
MMENTARKKVLQTGALMRVRRCGRYFATLIENIALFFRGLLPDRALSKAP